MKAEITGSHCRQRLGLGLSAATMCVFSLQALASASFDRDCPDNVVDDLNIVKVAGPPLPIDPANRDPIASATDLAANTEIPAEEMPVPSIASSSVIDDLLVEDEAAGDDPHGGEDEKAELPPTATRLPGVTEEDLPRFRRQMFRTDI